MCLYHRRIWTCGHQEFDYHLIHACKWINPEKPHRDDKKDVEVLHECQACFDKTSYSQQGWIIEDARWSFPLTETERQARRRESVRDGRLDYTLADRNQDI